MGDTLPCKISFRILVDVFLTHSEEWTFWVIYWRWELVFMREISSVTTFYTVPPRLDVSPQPNYLSAREPPSTG